LCCCGKSEEAEEGEGGKKLEGFSH
jgi:hypothetical protein